MTSEDWRTIAFVLLFVVAPFALVIITALLKNYTITVHFERREKRDDR